MNHVYQYVTTNYLLPPLELELLDLEELLPEERLELPELLDTLPELLDTLPELPELLDILPELR